MKLCVDCIHVGVCYRQGTVDLNYADKCGDYEPSRRKGHWVQLDYQRGKFECSECHTQGYVDTCMYEPKWKYCPICGAKMENKNE